LEHEISNDKNFVYCATLPLAWDEVRKEMIYDKPFLILLKRTNARNSYFGLWVTNSELIIKE